MPYTQLDDRPDLVHLPDATFIETAKEVLAAAEAIIRRRAGVSADDQRSVCFGCLTTVIHNMAVEAFADHVDAGPDKFTRNAEVTAVARDFEHLGITTAKICQNKGRAHMQAQPQEVQIAVGNALVRGLLGDDDLMDAAFEADAIVAAASEPVL